MVTRVFGKRSVYVSRRTQAEDSVVAQSTASRNNHKVGSMFRIPDQHVYSQRLLLQKHLEPPYKPLINPKILNQNYVAFSAPPYL